MLDVTLSRVMFKIKLKKKKIMSKICTAEIP